MCMCVCVCLCVQSVRGMLENPTQAVSEASYFDCIDAVMENSKVRTSLFNSGPGALSRRSCYHPGFPAALTGPG